MVTKAILSRFALRSSTRAVPSAFMLSAMLTLTVAVGPAPAFAQSLGEALRNMQRDVQDLFGTSEQRRRMIRRGEARRDGRPVRRKSYQRVEPLTSAPTPRLKPTPQEVAANEAARRARGVYNDPEFDTGDPRGAVAPEVAAVGRGGAAAPPVSTPPPPRSAKRFVDPLDALLGPEPSEGQGAGLSNGVSRSTTAAAPAPEPARPAALVNDGPSAALQQTAATSRNYVPSSRSAETGAPTPSGGFLSQPAVQITLAFLVGAGLLGLAVLREWRGRGPVA